MLIILPFLSAILFGAGLATWIFGLILHSENIFSISGMLSFFGTACNAIWIWRITRKF